MLIKVYDLPVGAHIMVEEGSMVKAGGMLVKYPVRLANLVISLVVCHV